MSHSDEFAFMSSSLENNDIDLSMRAPYIPMNESDDLPLLTEDLMWSAFSDELSLHKNIKEVMLQQSQAMLADGMVQHSFGTDGTEQMCIDDKQPMFGAPTNPTTYLTSKDDDCKQSKLIDQMADIDGSSHKYRIDGMHNGGKVTATATKTSGKKYMDKTMIGNGASEMDIIVPINENGIITAYTIQMVDEPILLKNG